MARFHVLAGNNNVYSVVVHTATPNGNNSAGVSWKVALVNSGMARTTMTEGNAAGQITAQEKASIEAGDVIEARLQWQDDPSWDNSTRLADVETRISQAVAARLEQLAAQLKWFGFVQA